MKESCRNKKREEEQKEEKEEIPSLSLSLISFTGFHIRLLLLPPHILFSFLLPLYPPSPSFSNAYLE